MAGEGLLTLVIAVEGAIILMLMAFNAYFLVQRPILHYIKEIYFINGKTFRQAWYLVISATTFFFLIHTTVLMGQLGVAIPEEQARWGATIFTLCFGTLIILAFSLVFSVFVRYVRRLSATDGEISDRLAYDMRKALLRDDREIELKIDVASVGDVTSARAQLGPYVSLAHYRALTSGFTAYMEHKLGQMGDAILYAVGRISGLRVSQEVLAESPSRDVALGQVLAEIQENGIGLPEVRRASDESIDFVLRESAPAAGTKPRGRPLCHYQAGLVAGIYEAFTGRPTLARETRCWGLGDKECEFHIALGR